MKITFLVLGAFLALTAFNVASADEKVKTTKRKQKVEVAEEHVSDGEPSSMRVGLGFATFGSGAIGGGGQAASALLEFGSIHSVQPFFAINSSTPFSFGLGGIYRARIHGNRTDGFHGGLGFNLGTVSAAAATTSFFCNIFPVVGFHFSLGGHVNNIVMHFDMGPNLAVTPSPFQFSAKPLSAFGGASMHYMF